MFYVYQNISSTSIIVRLILNLHLKGTGKTSSGASNIHLKINFTKQTYIENWHRRDFSVSAPLEGEEGGPGGRRDDRHGAPQHVEHQGHQD